MASAPNTLLTGKTAIVTGGIRGIGKGISLELVLRGANVAMVYMNPSSTAAAEAYAIELEGKGTGIKATAILADISRAENIPTIVSETLRRLDVKNIDIIVNNAAIADYSPSSSITTEQFEAVMNTNVRGPLFLVQAALPYIPSGGRIINISSYSARAMMKGPGIPTITTYAASKAALEGMTRGWAVEFGHSRGITANSVQVSLVVTETVKLLPEEVLAVVFERNKNICAAAPRAGEPDDIAQVVAFLASESSRWVTGSLISATGGIYAN